MGGLFFSVVSVLSVVKKKNITTERTETTEKIQNARVFKFF